MRRGVCWWHGYEIRVLGGVAELWKRWRIWVEGWEGGVVTVVVLVLEGVGGEGMDWGVSVGGGEVCAVRSRCTTASSVTRWVRWRSAWEGRTLAVVEDSEEVEEAGESDAVVMIALACRGGPSAAGARQGGARDRFVGGRGHGARR